MKRYKKNTFAATAVDYATRVLNGKEPSCWQIKAACQRFSDDFKRDDIVFDVGAIDHVCNFISALVHTKGKWAGEPIKLEPFQVFLLANIFGWVEVVGGLRRYREAFILLPRKMGKSIIAGGIGDYMTFADGEEGAEGYSGATSLDQAMEVFRPAKLMAEKSPGLAEALGIETAARSIYQPSTGSSFKPVIAKTKDGASPHIAICDELHQAIDDTQLSAFRTGMGARSQPLLLIISTAGVNLAGVCRSEQLEAEAVLAKTKRNDRLFSLIYTIDPEDDWKDPANLRKANPNMGVSVSERFLTEQLEEALQTPSKQAKFRTKHLNQWVASASGWLTTNLWGSAAVDGLKLEDYYGREAYLAVDISTRQDLTALTLVIVEDDRRLLFPITHLPQGAIDGSPNASAYRKWIEEGHLIETLGGASSFAEIADLVCGIAPSFDDPGEPGLIDHFKIVHATFDPWQGEWLRQRVSEAGIETSIWPANAPALWTKTMDDFEADLKNGQIGHPNHPVLNWCAANICAHERGVTRVPVKPGSRHLKIDAMITTLLAHAASQVKAADEVSYEVAWFD